jgi:exopolyphosphatase/guanosine-5'-triphosphate,3'-diphosphate pyrophosphatase
MRAVIDIGTNSILLLAGYIESDGRVKEVLQQSAITRLGDSLQGSGMITEDAVKRTEKVFKQYGLLLKKRGIEKVNLVATEILRVAGNRAWFIQRIEDKFGWQIQVLSGEEEAKYSYMGALDVMHEEKQPCLVMDVGGGSSEVILGKSGNIERFESLPVGAVRLWEKMDKKEQLHPEERSYLYDVIRDYFTRLSFWDTITPEHILVGIGGTITTLVAIQECMRTYDAAVVNGYCLTVDQMEALYKRINGLVGAARRKIAGLPRGREDIILYGMLIFLTLMQLTGMAQVIVSDRGLRFGYLKYLEEGIKGNKPI